MNNISKKSILITGAATGIGAATVKKICNSNVSLTLTTKSNLIKLEEIAEFARNCGANVKTICGDLSEKKFLIELSLDNSRILEKAKILD